ncbi:MAG: protein kinase [Thermodesulfobacteriota bacterium]
MAGKPDLKKVRAGVQEALKEKAWAKGAELLEEWCRQKPGDAKGWYYRAYFLVKLGRPAEAETAVVKALRLEPDFQDALKLRDYLDTEAQSRSSQAAVATGRQAVWQVGQLVDGRYEVKGSKKGGMGEVYFAFDRELDHMVAVKTPLATVLTSESQKARFYREAEAWMGLGMHPNICAAYYVQEIGGIPWLFIEYVGGGTLDDWLKARRVTLRDRLDIAIQTASGMNHTHTFSWRDEEGAKHMGLVHRDLKPANLLMDEAGVARVTDFGLVGLAQEEGAGESSPLVDLDGDGRMDEPEFGNVDWEIGADVHWQTVTVAGMALGTPPYMAPEQWQSAHLAGFPADIYAYGCILYDIFCGRRPFVLAEKYRHAMPAHQVYIWEMMHRKEEAPDPRGLADGLDDGLAELMLQCLAKNPGSRPGSFAEVRERLVEIYERLAKTAYPRPEPRASRLLADSLNNQAVSFMTIGQNRRAEACWREALKADPHHLEGTYNLALFQWKNNEIPFEEVQRRLEEVGRSHADSWRLQQLLGRMYLFFGEYAKGVQHLEQAASDESSGLKVERDLGLALCAAAGLSQDQDRWARVEEVFGRVMAGGLEDPWVVTGRALAFRRQGRDEEAEKLYQQAAATLGGFPETLEKAIHQLLPGQELIEAAPHRGWINHLAFTPAGDQVFCGSEDKVGLWSLRSGKAGAPDLSGARPAETIRERLLQAGLIRAACLSPDGTLILTGSSDGLARLWALETGQLLYTLRGHSMDVTCVAFSPDGRYALTGSADTTVRLWDTQTGGCFTTFEGHTEKVNAVTFSPDGVLVLSAADDHTLRVWDSYAEKCLHTLAGHTDRVTAAVFNPQGRLAFSAGYDKAIRVWEVSSGKPGRLLEAHTGRVSALAMTPDGKHLVSGGHDRTVRVWDLKTGKLEKTIRFDHRVEALGVSPDSRLAAAAVANAQPPDLKTVCLFEVFSQNRYQAPFVVTGPVSASKADKRDALFQKKLLEARAHLDREDYLEAHAALSEARTVPGYTRDPEALSLWTRLGYRFPHQRLRTAWELDVLRGHEGAVNHLTLDAKSRRLLSAGQDGKLRVWDAAEGECRHILAGHNGPVTAAAFYAQGRFAVSCGQDRTMRFWDLDGPTCTRVLMENVGEITYLSVSPDGRFALSVGGGPFVGLWDLRSQMWLRNYEGHTARVTTVSFSPDGRLAVSGGQDRTVRLWDLEKGTCRRVLRGPTNTVTDARITPDGRHVVSASVDQIFRKWGLEREEMPETFGGHAGPVTTLALSPDGKHLVSGSADKTVRLWDLKINQCLSVLRGHASRITSVAFGQNRQMVFSAGADGAIRRWHLDWEPDLQAPAQWDEEVRPFLDVFLTLKTAYAKGSLERVGRPHWNEADFQDFCQSLAQIGYGWVSPEGIARELKEMARHRHTRLNLRQALVEFYYALEVFISPFRYLRKPLIITLKLLPALAAGLLLWRNDFFGLPWYSGVLIVLFFVLIMLGKKK